MACAGMTEARAVSYDTGNNPKAIVCPGTYEKELNSLGLDQRTVTIMSCIFESRDSECYTKRVESDSCTVMCQGGCFERVAQWVEENL